MVQAVSSLLTYEAWVRSKFSPRESSEGQNDTGAGFFCPVKIIPTTLHSQFHLHIALTRRENGRNLGSFKKPKLLPKSGGLDINMLLFILEKLEQVNWHHGITM
jgi:hypothetical protein